MSFGPAPVIQVDIAKATATGFSNSLALQVDTVIVKAHGPTIVQQVDIIILRGHSPTWELTAQVSSTKWRLKQLNLIYDQDVFGVANTSQGVNSTYTLSATPAVTASVLVFLSGLLLRQTIDYTISGNVITYLGGRALISGTDSFIVSYVTQL